MTHPWQVLHPSKLSFAFKMRNNSTYSTSHHLLSILLCTENSHKSYFYWPHNIPPHESTAIYITNPFVGYSSCSQFFTIIKNAEVYVPSVTLLVKEQCIVSTLLPFAWWPPGRVVSFALLLASCGNCLPALLSTLGVVVYNLCSFGFGT